MADTSYSLWSRLISKRLSLISVRVLASDALSIETFIPNCYQYFAHISPSCSYFASTIYSHDSSSSTGTCLYVPFPVCSMKSSACALPRRLFSYINLLLCHFALTMKHTSRKNLISLCKSKPLRFMPLSTPLQYLALSQPPRSQTFSLSAHLPTQQPPTRPSTPSP